MAEGDGGGLGRGDPLMAEARRSRIGWLPLEKPLVELEEQIEELRGLLNSDELSPEERRYYRREVRNLEKRMETLRQEIFSHLTTWDKVQLARHPERPYTLDYLRLIFHDFLELHGDRLFGDDPAIVGGIAFLEEQPLMVIGHQKGRTLQERKQRNFGQARPEGYRKAIRLMKLAEKYRRPVVCFLDTPGAACLVEAEERGISEAIARSMLTMAQLRVPIVVFIIGEGGSGGAIALGLGDRVYMLEYAIYSVILPEACASIIWRDASKGPEAAEALQLTAEGALRFGLIDGVLPEPLGGAHRNPAAMAQSIRNQLLAALEELRAKDVETLLEERYQKFRRMGVWEGE